MNEFVTDDSRPKISNERILLLGITVTIFDGIASYINIAARGIAQEGNGLLNSLANFILANGFSEEASFAATMIARVTLGVILFISLFAFAQRKGRERESRLARFGLIMTCSVLSLLALYHLYGLLLID